MLCLGTPYLVSSGRFFFFNYGLFSYQEKIVCYTVRFPRGLLFHYLLLGPIFLRIRKTNNSSRIGSLPRSTFKNGSVPTALAVPCNAPPPSPSSHLPLPPSSAPLLSLPEHSWSCSPPSSQSRHPLSNCPPCPHLLLSPGRFQLPPSSSSVFKSPTEKSIRGGESAWLGQRGRVAR